jgi:hypothetical protein
MLMGVSRLKPLVPRPASGTEFFLKIAEKTVKLHMVFSHSCILRAAVSRWSISVPRIAPEAEVFATLQRFSGENPAWIAGDPGPAYARLVERLRARGTVGPLWSYFAMIQRLWPAGFAPTAG